MNVYWKVDESFGIVQKEPFEVQIDDEILNSMTTQEAMHHIYYCVAEDFSTLGYNILDLEDIERDLEARTEFSMLSDKELKEKKQFYQRLEDL
jgi:hypothetical protein